MEKTKTKKYLFLARFKGFWGMKLSTIFVVALDNQYSMFEFGVNSEKDFIRAMGLDNFDCKKIEETW